MGHKQEKVAQKLTKKIMNYIDGLCEDNDLENVITFPVVVVDTEEALFTLGGISLPGGASKEKSVGYLNMALQASEMTTKELKKLLKKHEDEDEDEDDKKEKVKSALDKIMEMLGEPDQKDVPKKVAAALELSDIKGKSLRKLVKDSKEILEQEDLPAFVRKVAKGVIKFAESK